MNRRLFLFIVSVFNILILSAEDRLRIEFVTPSIVRVTASVHDGYPENNTGACIYSKEEVNVNKTETDSEVVYKSSVLTVVVDKHTQKVAFVDKDGNVLLNQGAITYSPSFQERVIYDDKSAHVEETANGKVTVKDVIRRDTIGRSTCYKVLFTDDADARYGLGCQMEDYMNLVGKTVYLTQHNLKVHVPMLISTNGYGLLFDAGCAMVYDGKEKGQCTHHDCKDGTFSMRLEAAQSLDYYFVKGKDMNDVVDGYRLLTGKVSMMPRYVFGYTQSKERYVSSDDIINTLREYRRRHVPIDMIVQDWNYWPQGWGYMKMNPKYYPSPKALADSVHSMNAKLMVSIWPNPQWCPEAEDFKSRGMMLEHDVYDVFNANARKLYWDYANKEFFSQGFDAWWCDSSEPLDGDWNRIPATDTDGKPYGWDSQAYRWKLNKDVLSEALGAERSSLYSLYHSMGIYENQRQQESSKRVVNLTRSSYSGQQRYGTIVWNGDTHASWASFKQQIPAGLNYMATGNPYWTVDVGSFFTKDDGRRWFYKGEFPEGVKDDNYKEYYVRMFQWATFLPMLRSHGSDTPREIWRFGEPGTPYYDAILKMINIRYQHVPYIYSIAAMQSGIVASSEAKGASLARPLAFDFSADKEVLDLKDEYMFGDFLVCPVTDPMAEKSSRRVYLPKGAQWIDYWSGKTLDGGQWIDCALELGSLPLFVRQGSIIPTTEVAEYTDAQIGKPVTINVYPGANASFSLYEDEGDGYNYESGSYSVIPLSWSDKSQSLTIGKRTGSFKGMQQSRTFIVKTPKGTKTVEYNGKKITIKT